MRRIQLSHLWEEEGSMMRRVLSHLWENGDLLRRVLFLLPRVIPFCAEASHSLIFPFHCWLIFLLPVPVSLLVDVPAPCSLLSSPVSLLDILLSRAHHPFHCWTFFSPGINTGNTRFTVG